MASMMEQEKRKDGSSYARKIKQIQYPCGCKYLFDHHITLEHICHEHELELIALHG